MRKIILISLLLCGIILVGCSSNQESNQPYQPRTLSDWATNPPTQDTNQQQNIAPVQQTQPTNDLFAKKENCANLRDKMQEQLVAYPDNSTDCFDITQIFYSPARNSCLYIADSR